jgi:hypothetical protein
MLAFCRGAFCEEGYGPDGQGYQQQYWKNQRPAQGHALLRSHWVIFA